MVASRLAWSAGSATFTTVPSMNVMLEARMVAARVERWAMVIRGEEHERGVSAKRFGLLPEGLSDHARPMSRSGRAGTSRAVALAGAVLALAPLVFALVPEARGQEAVVLSGGASRGLAHAGVLVGLERRGHDPDIVTGTSMGSVIGALYAAGYPADSIWTLVRTRDWRELFVGF